MPTPDQLNEQYELERRQIKGGLDKLRKDTRTLEQKEYASLRFMDAALLINYYLLLLKVLILSMRSERSLA